MPVIHLIDRSPPGMMHSMPPGKSIALLCRREYLVAYCSQVEGLSREEYEVPKPGLVPSEDNSRREVVSEKVVPKGPWLCPCCGATPYGTVHGFSVLPTALQTQRLPEPQFSPQTSLTFENHVVREGLVGAATGGIRLGTFRANSRKETSRTFKVLRVNVPSLSSILNSTDVQVRFCPVENNITQPHYHPHLGPGPASNKEVVGHPITSSPQSRWL